MTDHTPPHGLRVEHPGRYMAGLRSDANLSDEAWDCLQWEGATIVARHPRLGLLELEVPEPAAFTAPDYVAFIEPVSAVSASRR